MNDAELIRSSEYSRSGVELAKYLPHFFPKDVESNNRRLLEPVGLQLDRLRREVSEIEDETHVQNTHTMGGLYELAKLVNLPPKNRESQPRYKTRVVAENKLLTNEATIPDILESVADVLNTDVENIEYLNLGENGAVIVKVPTEVINELKITTDNLIEIINRNSAAGFRIEVILSGEFTHRSVTDYESGVNEPQSGYGSLTEDGEPDEYGGAYSGTLSNYDNI